MRFESRDVFTIATIASAVEEVVEEAAPASVEVPSEGELKKEEKAADEGKKPEPKADDKKDAKK
jgi:hypothetical protein